MKWEGLVRSISTKGFPPSLLRSAYDCGFHIQSNDVVGNLLHAESLKRQEILDDHSSVSHLISSPLGGGILTQKYCGYREMAQMPLQTENAFHSLLGSDKTQPRTNFDRYRTVMDTVENIALRHDVSVESVSLRWLLQLKNSNSISVGTRLSMNLEEEQEGQKFNRHRTLRQVFAFELEEEDMQLLAEVSGHNLAGKQCLGTDEDPAIDFSNRALWI